MMRRIWTAFIVEVLKALRQRHTLLGPLLVMAAVTAAALAHPMARDGRSDYDFVALATPATLNLLGFLLLLVWSACLISPELGSGAVRLFLVRPVGRGEYVAAKFMAAAGYAALLTAVTGLCAWTLAAALGELHGVDFGGELLHTREAMLSAYALGALLSLLPMWAGASCALFFSACTRNTGAAVTLSIGSWLALDLAKHPLGVEAWVFTTYLEAPWQVFVNRCDGLPASWTPMAWQCAAASLPVMAAALAGAVLVTSRRNLAA